MSDLGAIFGVLVTVHGHLQADQLRPDLVRHLTERLTRHGPLHEGASAGELNALLADLCQRMHWAMSEDFGDYPAPMPRRTIYYLDVPSEKAVACVAALVELGGDDVTVQQLDGGEARANRRQIPQHSLIYHPMLQRLKGQGLSYLGGSGSRVMPVLAKKPARRSVCC